MDVSLLERLYAIDAAKLEESASGLGDEDPLRHARALARFEPVLSRANLNAKKIITHTLRDESVEYFREGRWEVFAYHHGFRMVLEPTCDSLHVEYESCSLDEFLDRPKEKIEGRSLYDSPDLYRCANIAGRLSHATRNALAFAELSSSTVEEIRESCLRGRGKPICYFDKDTDVRLAVPKR